MSSIVSYDIYCPDIEALCQNISDKGISECVVYGIGNNGSFLSKCLKEFTLSYIGNIKLPAAKAAKVTKVTVGDSALLHIRQTPQTISISTWVVPMGPKKLPRKISETDISCAVPNLTR